MSLHARIFTGLVVGIAVGALARVSGVARLQDAVIATEIVGTAFMRLITMVVVPLVIGSLFVGVASLGDIRALGRIGGRTILYFLGTTAAAAVIGVIIAQLAPFGPIAGVPAADASPPLPTVTQSLLNLIPQNPFDAAVRGDLLPLIVAVCLFAAAATTLDTERRGSIVRFFARMNDLSMVVIGWLMTLAPVAVFALIAATVARGGAGLLLHLALFSAVVVLALVAHVTIVLVPMLRFGAKRRIGEFARAVSDAVVLAVATASSSVTLPVSIAAATERLGISTDVASFVLPAGATINKNGAAAYKAVTAVFVAAAYGMALGPAELATVVVMATVAAFAGAGVPGSSLVTTLIVLNAIGLGPRAAAGIALVAAIDRPLDMCRTAVNTMGNLVGAAWVARSAAASP
jgi:Na+/H+-dicarboxylate symporter